MFDLNYFFGSAGQLITFICTCWISFSFLWSAHRAHKSGADAPWVIGLIRSGTVMSFAYLIGAGAFTLVMLTDADTMERTGNTFYMITRIGVFAAACILLWKNSWFWLSVLISVALVYVLQF